MSTEAGMPILLKTLCQISAHVWLHTGSQFSPKTPKDGARCDCGHEQWSSPPAPGGGSEEGGT